MQYAEAIPLPIFEVPAEQQHNLTALQEHHRPISPAGERMLHHLKVNLAAPNALVYGDEEHRYACQMSPVNHVTEDKKT